MVRMEALKNRLGQIDDEPVGDGRAVFLPDMTDAEVEDYERNSVRGWGKVLDRLGIK